MKKLYGRDLLKPCRRCSGFHWLEYPWHPSVRRQDLDKRPPSDSPHWGLPVPTLVPTVDFIAEEADSDASLDDSLSLPLPTPWMVEKLGLRPARGTNTAWLDTDGRVAFFDPSVSEGGPGAALIRVELLRRLLEEEGLALIWIGSGEKMVLSPRFYGRHSFAAAYTWDGTKVRGKEWSIRDKG